VRSLRLPTVLAASLAVIAGAACGGGDDGGGGTPFPREEADVVATAFDIGFREDAYEASAGEVKFFYVNEGSAPHTLLIEDSEGNDVAGFKLEVSSRGDVDAGAVALEAGEYTVYCDIPGHRQAGMHAPLSVG
jgi:uncharacterized cupredoxin-like copper-binding protein